MMRCLVVDAEICLKSAIMKTLFLMLMLCAIAQAQDNRPKSSLSGKITGRESMTGAPHPMSGMTKNPAIKKTTATQSTTTGANAPVKTLYGKNNDGSSTGTTVTGSGAPNWVVPREDVSPSPGNKAGGWIVTPRPR